VKQVDHIPCPFCEYRARSKSRWTRHVKSTHHKTVAQIQKLKKEYGVNILVTKSERESSAASKKTKLARYGSSSYNNRKKAEKTLLERHGVSNPGQIEEVREKVRKTVKERYGCNNVFQSDEVKRKTKETVREKFGVDHIGESEEIRDKIEKSYEKRFGCHPFASDEIKEQIRQTMVDKHGVEHAQQHPEIREKTKRTCRKRYGHDSHLSCPSVQEKISATCEERYGGSRPACDDAVKEKIHATHVKRFGSWFSQTDEHHRSNFQWKDYVMPDGSIVRYQGYENLALDALLENHAQNDIIVSTKDISIELGEIWYEHDGSMHRYFPDIFIRSTRAVIEVKSLYTFQCDRDKNRAKRQACLDIGVQFEFWVFDREGNRV